MKVTKKLLFTHHQSQPENLHPALLFLSPARILIARILVYHPWIDMTRSALAYRRLYAGYHVLAVLNEDNFRCMKPGEKLLIIQAPESTSERDPSEFSWESILNILRVLNLEEYANQISAVSPALTREQLLNQLKEASHSLRRNGCPPSLPVTTILTLSLGHTL
jgi:hypothetical protein